MKYAAFLRGINVGGNSIVMMTDLQKLLERIDLRNVKTILASGNTVFESNGTKVTLEKKLEAELKKKYKKDIVVFVRTIDELRKLDKLKPFKKIKVTPNTRLYVTFCKTAPKTWKPLKEHPGYKVLGASGTAVFSVLELQPNVNTPDLMTILGKQFGDVTMRNWNTIQKVIKAG